MSPSIDSLDRSPARKTGPKLISERLLSLGPKKALRRPYECVYMLFLLLTSLAYGLNSYFDLLRAKAPAKAQIKSR